MEINDKKFTRTRKVINFLISFILAAFLIMLSNTIIGDLDNTITRPAYNDFVDTAQKQRYDDQHKNNDLEIKNLYDSRKNIEKMISTAKENKEAEQQSFDNWIKSRSTLGSAQQDPEVIKRLRKLDEYQQILQSWEIQSDSISKLISPFQASNDEIYELEQEADSKVSTLFHKAIDSYDLKVFLIRLLFATPILALGIFLFLRRRRHKFSPLFMGFSLFSVYVFFVGLVPYLPSYGGYIRYTVGILLTIGLGYYAIKRLIAYQEKKSAELKVSSTERASNLQGEIAEKAFNNHICPSCGKDFLLKNWEGLSVVNIKQPIRPLIASNFCRHCGMQLIKKCGKCEQENYAHLPFCINCGDKMH